MKNRFNTYDVVCSVTELQKLVGMRLAQVYDIDHKTYLFKMQRGEEKAILLIESGSRFHTTAFEWPKNVSPSGFSMKMRKHIRNKRLELLRQFGIDRIVDMQFGSGEAAYHVILELYDRGNVLLADCNLIILNVLRPHTEGEEVRFAVREKYPVDRAHQRVGPPSQEQLKEFITAAKEGDTLRKILNPHLEYGPAVIDHVLLKAGLPSTCKLHKGFELEDIPRLHEAMREAEDLIDLAMSQPSKGYILQKREKRPNANEGTEDLYTNQEFHPMLFAQHAGQPNKEFDSFNMAVDEFFSSLESQKIDVKALNQEREAMKKLQNVRRDHEERLVALQQTQESDKHRAELITRNQLLVDSAVLAVRSALANQLPWPEVNSLVKEAAARGDPVASTIKQLKLDINHVTLLLSDPFGGESDEDNVEVRLKPTLIDINLDLTAYANAKKYYDLKRTAAKKQQKTLESQGKALKSAEKKTKQTLKEVQAITTINKARKTFWFEKFFWFISSENYLVIGGRDQQQNELVVKRYLRATDIYVHADIQGASSLVIKNPSEEPVPPKTLNEAGVMAVCYSVAWEAKVVTSAWWVRSEQVSKTAPTGEYLSTGSFMVRGKKNYLPPCHLIMGFGFLFKLEESSISRHKDERRMRTLDEDEELPTRAVESDGNEEEIVISDEDESNEADQGNIKLNTISEESIAEPHFPDTEVTVEHALEKSVARVTLDGQVGEKQETDMDDMEERVVFLGDDVPVIIRPNKKVQQAQHFKPNPQPSQVIKYIDDQNNQKGQLSKRGQKGKLKKIKEKYKDQDDDERKLRMDILQSAGSGKESKKSKKVSSQAKVAEKKATNVARPIKVVQSKEGGDSDGEEAAEEPVFVADVDMLDSLTGVPSPEDELLFAIPVVAPYNTLSSYKYKVKLTPGTGKRGKAARTAVTVFLRDRAASAHEKDLLRSVKDELLARNLPGKVKVSAPQLQKHRK